MWTILHCTALIWLLSQYWYRGNVLQCFFLVYVFFSLPHLLRQPRLTPSILSPRVILYVNWLREQFKTQLLCPSVCMYQLQSNKPFFLKKKKNWLICGQCVIGEIINKCACIYSKHCQCTAQRYNITGKVTWNCLSLLTQHKHVRGSV